MPRSGKERVLDMLKEARFLERSIVKLTRENFLNDEVWQRAFARSIEILGEAAKNVAEDSRSLSPEIPWKRIAGMRDRVIHDYAGVDLALVWEVATVHAPVLAQQLETLLNQIESQPPT